MRWAEFVDYMKGQGYESALLDCPALPDALDREYPTVQQALRHILSIDEVLLHAELGLRHGRTSATAASIARMRQDKAEALRLIRAASGRLNERFRHALTRIAREIAADDMATRHVELVRFDYRRKGRRGRAAQDDRAAWAGWCVRELDARISPEARNRFATISKLLAIPGIEVSPQSVRAILKAGRT